MSRIGSKLLVIREAANIIHTEEKGSKWRPIRN